MAKRKLRGEEIVEQWSNLIEDVQGKGEQVYSQIRARLEELEPPQVISEKKQLVVKDSFFGLGGQTRTSFVIQNKIFRGYKVYVGARDYGKQLMVNWYLVCEPSKLEKLIKLLTLHWAAALVTSPIIILLVVLSAIFKKSVLPQNLNLFDLEELTAYITTVHHSVLDAVKEVMEDMDLDFTKVDRKSRGFFNLV